MDKLFQFLIKEILDGFFSVMLLNMPLFYYVSFFSVCVCVFVCHSGNKKEAKRASVIRNDFLKCMANRKLVQFPLTMVCSLSLAAFKPS